MSRIAYFTICSNNYMAYALTLGRSLRSAHPDAEFTIILADNWDADAAPEAVEFPIIESCDLGLPTFDDMKTRYTVLEFNTAIKPKAIQHLMGLGADHVVYLDPDIYIVSPLKELEDNLHEGFNAILTPHALAPLDDGGDPDDVRLMRTGAYNLGFAAFTRSDDTLEFLKWWQRRLETDCRVALSDGLFVDQKFMDLAPCYLDKVKVLRHAGYNVAYWNLMHRPVTRRDGIWLAGASPLRFFHFSGVIPGDRDTFSKHQNRFSVKNIGGLKTLLHAYLDDLNANGHAGWSSIPYAYDQLDGQRLDPFLRRVYARRVSTPPRNANLRSSDIAALATQNAPEGFAARPITEYALEIWRAREDLRATFDLNSQAGFDGYCDWLLTSGRKEHGIPNEHLRWIDADRKTTPANRAQAAPTPALQQKVLHQVVKWTLNSLDLLRPIYKRLPRSLVQRIRRVVLRNSTAPTTEPAAGLTPLRGKCRPGVAVYGYFNTESGVGEGARQAVNVLSHTPFPLEAFTLTPSGQFQNNTEFPDAQPLAPSLASVRLLHVNADQTPAVMASLGGEAQRRDIYKIGYWAWELERFPAAWWPAADQLDEIWTPSEFTKNAIAAAIDRPVVRVPHAVELPELLSPRDRQMAREEFGIPAHATAFLNTFDFNSFIERKNPWGALEAFQRVHDSNKDTVLIFKTHGASATPQRRRAFLEAAESTPGVLVIDTVLSRASLRRLQSASDVFVSLHRSEGFGLNLLEMMALGKPVVATNYSGNTDFVDHTVGIPVDYVMTPVGDGAYPHADGQSWAAPDIRAAIDAMLALSADESLRARLGQAARARVRNMYSVDAVRRLAEERLSRILDDARLQ